MMIDPKADLTRREVQVLEAIALGYSAKEIAEMLGITLPTVNSHIGRIKTKTGASKNTELSLVWFCRTSGISIQEMIMRRLLPVVIFLILTFAQTFTGHDPYRSSRSGRRVGRRNEIEQKLEL